MVPDPRPVLFPKVISLLDSAIGHQPFKDLTSNMDNTKKKVTFDFLGSMQNLETILKKKNIDGVGGLDGKNRHVAIS